jgi:anti-anti-sigma factor
MSDSPGEQPVRSERVGDVGVIYAGDYLNKLSGERVERECRARLADGCRALVVDFQNTGMVNSIGVSILLGVIDAAERARAQLVFSAANPQATQIFDMLGLSRHVRLTSDRNAALSLLAKPGAAGSGSNH